MRGWSWALISVCLAAQEHPQVKDQRTHHPKIATPGPEAREKAWTQRQALLAETSLGALPFRCVGPMGQGGRVVALAVDGRRPSVMVAAFATGGLWLTEDAGASWTSLFDHQPAFAIGEVAVRWGAPGVPAELWVGTGEANASRSSYAGAGLFRSTDRGATWQRMGLAQSHRIARIDLHPTDPKVILVAAQGPLYTEGGERGVYRSTDGGRTWSQVLRGGERTGATDLVRSPQDPNLLFAALWEKDRKPWSFLESGAGSGIHRSTDGGATWVKLEGGLPAGPGVGRIGLAVSHQDARRVYAYVDNQDRRPATEMDPYADPEAISPKKLKDLTEAQAAALPLKRWEDFLRQRAFPKSLKAAALVADLKAGKTTVKDVLAYLGDANAALFDTDIVGQELYASADGGATWTRTHTGRLEGLGYTYGYYFGQVRVDPADDRHLYLWGVPLLESRDGGRTFQGLNGQPEYVIHSDHHALWIDPQDARRMVVGHDGGLDFSTDGGRSWRGLKGLPVGQFYTIHADQAEPYRIYGGLQDNGVRTGPATALRTGQQQDGWRSLYGGDGAYVQVDPRDNKTAYVESQFGYLSRLDAKGTHEIRPRHAFKAEPYRFNWITPVVLSPHSAEILYTGTQKVLRSLDRGETWTEISGDLTTRPAVADVPFGTLTSLAESPRRFGLLYAGTDDGQVWCSRDGGFAWAKAGRGLPRAWVTRLEPSRFEEGTVYATCSATREDASAAHVYRSTDYGATWTSLKANLPEENVNVIREDSERKDLLYVGTDFGVYASLDGGGRWEALAPDMPNVPVHDLFVQAKARDLIVGTHGRSAWVAPLAPLQQLTAEVRAKPAHLFPQEPLKAQAAWKKDRPSWYHRGAPAERALYFHLAKAGPATLRLLDEKGVAWRTWTLEAKGGLTRVAWDLMVDRDRLPDLPTGRRPFVVPGAYTLELAAAGQTSTTALKITAPPEPAPGAEEDEDEERTP